jgi:hypothetical protein
MCIRDRVWARDGGCPPANEQKEVEKHGGKNPRKLI